jgi:hypothetical protein
VISKRGGGVGCRYIVYCILSFDYKGSAKMIPIPYRRIGFVKPVVHFCLIVEISNMFYVIASFYTSSE